MYLRDLWASLVRRWLLVLVCLAATAGAAVYVAQHVEPTYESHADVVLVPPRSTEDPTSNRYLSLGGLRQAVDVLTRSLGADRVHEDVEGLAPHGTFEVVADATTSAPILVITAEAPTSAEAQAVLDAVIAQIPVTLTELQDSIDIAAAHRIAPQTVARDEKPTAVHSSQMRAVGATVALLLALSALLVGAVDRRRLMRAQAERAAAAAAELTPVPAPDEKRPKPRTPVTMQQVRPTAPTTRKPNVARAKVGS